MNYFNYFSQCAKKAKSRSGMKGMIAFVILLVFVGAGAYGFFALQAIYYQAQWDALQELKVNPDFLAQQAAADQTAQLLTEVNADYVAIAQVDNSASIQNVVNKELADTINGCMQGAYIKRFTVSNNQVTLEGYAENIAMVTTIERRLRGSSAFSTVYVSVIKNKTGQEPDLPQFTCQLVLKGGAFNK